MSIIKAFVYTLLVMILWVIILASIIISFKYFFVRLDDPVHLFGISKLVAVLGSFLMICFYFWKPKFDLRDSLKISNYRPKIYLYLPLVAIGLFLINKPFWDIEKIVIFYQSDMESEPFGFEKGISRSMYDYISILLIAPIIEELFFRKFLLGKLIEKNKVNLSLLISSLCFSLIHVETPNNIVPAFIGGIILGSVYLKTRKIGYAVLLHFLFNLIVTLTEYVGFSYNNWLLGYNFNVDYWLLFGIGILVMLFGIKRIFSVSKM